MAASDESPPPSSGFPHYGSRESLATRAAGSESVPDDAVTELDRPRFTNEMIASWAEQPPKTETPSDVVQVRPERASIRLAMLFVVAVLGGVLGAVFGVWLMLK